jgi:hypothetical protein
MLLRGLRGRNYPPRLLGLWDDLRDVIVDRRMLVKERLVEMGKVAERFDEQQRGRSH